jgi:hypothetical protein
MGGNRSPRSILFISSTLLPARRACPTVGVLIVRRMRQSVPLPADQAGCRNSSKQGELMKHLSARPLKPSPNNRRERLGNVRSIAIQVQNRAVKDIVLDPRNPKQHPPKQINRDSSLNLAQGWGFAPPSTSTVKIQYFGPAELVRSHVAAIGTS